ncbi:50S ribosomal protein L32e [Nanoarchaeota archaeon]
MEVSKLLELRKKIKQKKPDFIRHDANKKKRVGQKWRKPKGRHNKMRLNIKGYKIGVRKGFGSPKEVKGLNKEGLEEIRVETKNELSNINKDSQIITLSSKLGLKKKIEILKEAKKLGIKSSNVKDIDAFLTKTDEDMKKKKEEKEKTSKKKEEMKKEAEKRAEEKAKEQTKEGEAEKTESSDELAAKLEKEEKDKVLTKKQ